ncbi:MAG: hypothetical protein WAM41_01725 [Psychrobacillus psychrotolerans]
MSLILARENANNLLDTCSRTFIGRGVRATRAKVESITVKENPL